MMQNEIDARLDKTFLVFAKTSFYTFFLFRGLPADLYRSSNPRSALRLIPQKYFLRRWRSASRPTVGLLTPWKRSGSGLFENRCAQRITFSNKIPAK
jgi:hypothetical protein